MNANAITNFASQLGAQIGLNLDSIVEKKGRYYLVNPSLKPLVRPNFFYAGLFLGKAKDDRFFPSFNLLAMLAKKDVSRVVVNAKAAWLFICGRDVLGKGILRIQGSGKRNTNTLVLNAFGECLGFGRIIGKLRGTAANNEIVVRNVLDIGDFLRRER